MKTEITLKQKEKIIKRAKIELEEWDFLCVAINRAIRYVTGTSDNTNLREIKKIFPRFLRSIARKHFHAHERGSSWWGEMHGREKKLRLQFLDYLLTGKLPKKSKVKQ